MCLITYDIPIVAEQQFGIKEAAKQESLLKSHIILHTTSPIQHEQNHFNRNNRCDKVPIQYEWLA